LLVIATGGPWAFLQSVAWTGMLINYSREVSFAEAVTKTFDGKHPCRLCQKIETGKQGEKKASSTLTLKRQEAFAQTAGICIGSFSDFELVSLLEFRPILFPSDSPPTPPPRSHCG